MNKTFLIIFTLALFCSANQASKPNILMVLVDDFGWGNVGWHQEQPNPEVVTPNMNELVKEGVELNRHYVHFTCTPTRSSFQSGRLPIHVQMTLAGPCQPINGIPRNMTGIAQKLGQAGYKTHIVGKWDAGMMTPTHTPKGRGYDSSLTYFDHGNWAWSENQWGGSENEKTEVPSCNKPNCAKDLWDFDHEAADILNHTVHEEYIFRERLQEIVNNHSTEDPLFLMYTPKLIHYPLQAPKEYVDKFSFINQTNRQMYHAMVNFVDDQIGNVTQMLKDKGLWENTLMVLSTDNGGYVNAMNGPCNTTWEQGTVCFNGEAGANNYPLKGGKYSSFEGGIRGNAFVSGGYLPKSQRGTVSQEMIHVADWYSTFCHLAGVDPTDTEAEKWGLPPIDSLNVWSVINGDGEQSPREEYIYDHNAYMYKQYKVLAGTQGGNGWGGVQYPNETTAEGHDIHSQKMNCKSGCLYDVVKDPTEHHDLSSEQPEMLAEMMKRLEAARSLIWNRNDSKKHDPRCYERAFDTWGGFLGPYAELNDYEIYV